MERNPAPGTKAAEAVILIWLVVLALLSLRIFLPDDWLTKETFPAWVQGIGSVLAIFASVALYRRQNEDARKRESDQAQRSELRVAHALVATMEEAFRAAELTDLRLGNLETHEDHIYPWLVLESAAGLRELRRKIGAFPLTQLPSADWIELLSAFNQNFDQMLVRIDLRERAADPGMKLYERQRAHGCLEGMRLKRDIASSDLKKLEALWTGSRAGP